VLSEIHSKSKSYVNCISKTVKCDIILAWLTFLQEYSSLKEESNLEYEGTNPHFAVIDEGHVWALSHIVTFLLYSLIVLLNQIVNLLDGMGWNNNWSMSRSGPPSSTSSDLLTVLSNQFDVYRKPDNRYGTCLSFFFLYKHTLISNFHETEQ
jgi:hypothetical protein